ncbi:MAG: aminopeptidase P family protein [Deltaproteobacteria bacterium]|nr:aminopeptidase P family protein [Deltaproteobacteria bacterium]
MTTARFIYDKSENNADLFYATKFDAPDAYAYVEYRKKTYVLVSDLELDRARGAAQVSHVIPLRTYREKLAKTKKDVVLVDLFHAFFAELGVRTIVVPPSTPFSLVDALRKKKIRVESGGSPFFPARVQKTKQEWQTMINCQKAVFGAVKLTEETLRKSNIRGNRIWYRGAVLTSERLRSMVNVHLLEHGYMAKSPPIISSGVQACDPHEDGTGPLLPNTSIIVDIFPQSLATRFHGDATRTFCKGRASDALKKLYATVLKGQELGIKMVKAGVHGNKIHNAIHALFEKEGYKTGEIKGRMQGFFHGTGHSIGLEIHEEPARINASDYRLQAGNVMSVEPGLYYPEIGGVRIEDLVYVTKTGCEVLGRYPKKLEIR